MNSHSIDTLKIGDKAAYTKTITETDVYLFSGITGDINPAHLNAQAAADTPFKKRIAHGILTSGLISAVLGVWLPGPGTIYMGQELKFTRPVYFNDTITAEVEVQEILMQKNIVKMQTVCKNQHGEVVIEGIATVRPPLHSA
ncbi:MaoC family dehydratase [Eubacterium sp. 1001713B170207_170306_E7]|uniref:MaoC family dehydratase n=1 Tax=Eubacterium sp. 1001713B170207_170306_E7 TaxID=2787097 RepID=UPI00189B9498|nr:MaoC family dehydratase [Eubacterium sp. 1001713B170207_170306_E7]